MKQGARAAPFFFRAMSATLNRGQIGESRSKLRAFAAGRVAPLPLCFQSTLHQESRVSTDDTPETESNVPAALPVLPLRDVVVYPHMVIPLFVGREKSILALEQAMKVDKQILLLAQKQADVDEPVAKDLYEVGTIATVLQLLKLPDGTVKVLVEGVERASVSQLESGEFFTAVATPLTDGERYDEREMDVLVRSAVTQFEQYVKLNRKVPPEVLQDTGTYDLQVLFTAGPGYAMAVRGNSLAVEKSIIPLVTANPLPP